MLPESPLYLVHERDDDVDALTFVRALAGPRERVVCELTPRTARTRGSLDWLVNDLLRALGKDVGLAARNAQAAYDSLVAWLAADEVTDLIIDRAHLVSAGMWSTLAELSAVVNARLWLVYSQPAIARGHRTWCESWNPAMTEFSGFERHWAPASTPAAAAVELTDAKEPFPGVPHSDFLLFRADARQLLTGPEFAVVEGSYRAAMERTSEWLDTADDPGGEDVAAYLHELVEDCTSTDEALTRLRAAQATMFLRGWWTLVDTRVFLAARAASQLTFDDSAAAALRRFLLPQYAAAATLALATNASYTTLSDLRMADAEPDGCHVRLSGREWDLPASARPLLRAHLFARWADGARDEDPLFSDRKAYDPAAPASAAALRRALDKSREVGVRCTRHWNDQHAASATTTMRRVGVTVQALA